MELERAKTPFSNSKLPLQLVLNAKTPLQNDENRLQNAPRKPDGQGDIPAENALVEALEGLFEKTLAEAAAEAVDGERGTGNGEQETRNREQEDQDEK